jgi:Domain of unknown function (4846)
MRVLLLSMVSLALMCCCGQTDDPGQDTAPVLAVADTGSTIVARFATPLGYSRIHEPDGSFGQYLRTLPLKPVGAAVHLFNGDLKWNQRTHAAVVEMSVGSRDLQQCADAVMRLRAEYLYSVGRQDEIAFNFTNGFRAEWQRWRNGERIQVDGNRCSWVRNGKPDSSHTALLAYLQQVFSYAGTLSLEKELIGAPSHALQTGDVFIHGGSPGHAVIVVDVVRNNSGQQLFMLAQSYMPAQDIHVLVNDRNETPGPWFILNGADKLYTPEWTFEWAEHKRWP